MQFLTNSFRDRITTGADSPRRLRQHVSCTFKILAFASFASFSSAALSASEKATANSQVTIVEPGGITLLPQASSTAEIQFFIRDNVALSLAVLDDREVASGKKEVLLRSIETSVSGTANGNRILKFAAPLLPAPELHRGEYSGNLIVLAQYN